MVHPWFDNWYEDFWQNDRDACCMVSRESLSSSYLDPAKILVVDLPEHGVKLVDTQEWVDDISQSGRTLVDLSCMVSSLVESRGVLTSGSLKVARNKKTKQKGVTTLPGDHLPDPWVLDSKGTDALWSLLGKENQ